MSDLIAAVKAETLRLRRWPAFWVLLAAWLALNLTFTYVFNYIAYRSGSAGRMSNGLPRDQLLGQMLPAAVPEVFTQGMALFGGALMLVLGALATGSGYGWGTWKTALTQGPSRITVIGATIVALAGTVVALVAVVYLVDTGVAALIASSESQSAAPAAIGRTLAGMGSAIMILAMWTLAGALIGAAARGPALAVGLGLVWVLVVENLLRGVASLLGALKPVTDYLPGTAAGSLAGAMRTVRAPTATPGVLDTLTATQSVATLAAYLTAFTAMTAYLVHRRDLA
ncbi:MAG: ABC transporter permease subunit [Mycobacteriaceae bacterium]|nr:ABC transporter permease subunit [Mycobacteriaceae bacterium]